MAPFVSKRKLSAAERASLQVMLEDISYTCGASLDELDLPDRLSTVVIHNHQCGDGTERLYYSAGYEKIYASTVLQRQISSGLLPNLF